MDHTGKLFLVFGLIWFAEFGKSCKSSSSQDKDSDHEEGVIFFDDFDTLDLDKWQHEITAGGGGNWEFQYYTNNRTNSYVRDGILYIKPTLTEEKYDTNFIKYGTLDLEGSSPSNLCTGRSWFGCSRTGNYNAGTIVNPIQSARLRTVNSFTFTYGTVEVEAKLPAGDWIWPAIWLLPASNSYGDWPASGEIDIMESRGNLNLTTADGSNLGAQSIGSTLHWGPYYPHNAYELTHGQKTLDSGRTFADDFHVFKLEWTETALKFFVDNEMILNAAPPNDQSFWEWGDFSKHGDINNPWAAGSKMAPFDQSFYLVMNVAVGGTNSYFPDDATNDGAAKPWKNNASTAAKDFWDRKDDWFPTWKGEDAAMQIKSVKVSKMMT